MCIRDRSKKLVRQQTGLGESAPPSVGFADDTKDTPSKKLVSHGIGPDASDLQVAPLPPLLRGRRAARVVLNSVSAINMLKDSAKGMGVAAYAKGPDNLDGMAHVLPNVAVASAEEMIEDLECRTANLKQDLSEVRATFQAAVASS